VDWTEADRISAAVLSCSEVAGMSAGPFGEVRCYLPGRTVPGVTVDDDVVDVHVVAHFGPPLDAVVEQITAAVSPQLRGRRLHVTVEDIALPDDEADDDRAARTGKPNA
jgi:uncharacterized alkaline shock family protein YloU